jgi:hypothetical protein
MYAECVEYLEGVMREQKQRGEAVEGSEVDGEREKREDRRSGTRSLKGLWDALSASFRRDRQRRTH